MSRNLYQRVLLAAVVIAVTTIGGWQLYAHRHFDVPIVAGPGVTRVGLLSDYCPSLKGGIGDTNVFFLEGDEPGGTALVIANTHPNEIASGLSAFLIVENCVVEKGNLIVIPMFHNSASRTTKPGDGYPLYFPIETAWGTATFRMGSRDASPVDQWPDPDVYIHYPEGQSLSYIDIRNTNRTWPGRENGVLAERITYAAMQLMQQENVDIAFDIHGAETMFPVTNCIVAPDQSMRIAAMASLTVKCTEGFDNHVEPSPSNFHGLSHREIANHSDVLPFLLEAPIPFLDQPTGPKTVKLLLDGKDSFLLSLSRQGRLFVPYDENGWPIENRVGQHTSVILEVMHQWTRKNSDAPIIVTGVPKYEEVCSLGVGEFLLNPDESSPERVYYE
jgi:hypothetical protein